MDTRDVVELMADYPKNVGFICGRWTGTIHTSTLEIEFLKCPDGSLEVLDDFSYSGDSCSKEYRTK